MMVVPAVCVVEALERRALTLTIDYAQPRCLRPPDNKAPKLVPKMAPHACGQDPSQCRTAEGDGQRRFPCASLLRFAAHTRPMGNANQLQPPMVHRFAPCQAHRTHLVGLAPCWWTRSASSHRRAGANASRRDGGSSGFRSWPPSSGSQRGLPVAARSGQ